MIWDMLLVLCRAVALFAAAAVNVVFRLALLLFVEFYSPIAHGNTNGRITAKNTA